MENKSKRKLNCLSALSIRNLKYPGLYSDGGGLYLQISKDGCKSFIYRYQSPIFSKRRKMGLGAFGVVTLAEARDKASACRKLVDAGKDPIKERNDAEVIVKLAAAKTKTFRECAEEYIEKNKKRWTNPKHAAQWDSTMSTYAYPIIGNIPVSEVDKPLILKILNPIWEKKTETATRVRSRIECILDFASFHEYRTGENPARWRGFLDKIFAQRSEIQPVEHHASLEYFEIGEFVEKLRQNTSITAKALETIILTATRTGEALKAKWNEVNFEERCWTIPRERMKAGVAHKIPLSSRMVELFTELQALRRNDFIFPGTKGHLSNTPVLQLVKEISGKNLTTHGMRSTMRCWGSEKTNYPNEVLEAALAHTIKNKVEAAYNRTDHYMKRKKLMQDWSDYCSNVSKAKGDVIDMHREALA